MFGARRGLSRSVLFVVALLAFAGRASAQSAPLPLYEIEALGWAAYTPDYPGASQSHIHFMALPWLTYRGDILRSEEGGHVAGRILHSDRFELDISAAGSFPSHSANDSARSGMPDLDWMGEVGPRARMNIYYWQNMATGQIAKIGVELPVRAVFSTNLTSRFDYRGETASPEVFFEGKGVFGTKARVKLGAGPIFATKELTGYFYQVDPKYAEAGRPAYTAHGGYMGSQAELGVTVPVLDWVKAFGKTSVNYYGGSANADSPLMGKKTNVSAMFGMSFSLYRSQEMAKR